MPSLRTRFTVVSLYPREHLDRADTVVYRVQRREPSRGLCSHKDKQAVYYKYVSIFAVQIRKKCGEYGRTGGAQSSFTC